MNFTGLYPLMKLPEDFTRVDLEDVEGTVMYLDGEAEERLKVRLSAYPVRGIRLLDNGNYHYMTRLFLSRLTEEVDLLVFDNHSDDQPCLYEGMKSCGSWIADSRRELGERLGSVTLIQGRGRRRTEGVMDVRRPLYISIDKDVLKESEAPVNWDQSDMTTEELLDAIGGMAGGRRVAGFDICGECAARGGIFDPYELSMNERADLQLIGSARLIMRE